MAVEQREVGLSDNLTADPVPAVFNGATFAEEPLVPSSVTAGGTIQITGVAGFDCTTCFVDREIRIVAEFTHLNEPRVDNVGKLSGRGETAPFGIEAPAPATEGESTTVRLKAQRNPPIGDWETDNTRGPFTINAVSQGEQIVRDSLNASPWVLGGGAVGLGAASLADQPLIAGAGLGGAVGLGAYTATQGRAGSLIPDFPTTTVLATAALLGTAGFLLSQAPNLPSPSAARSRLSAG